tara:strand:+ start:5220 stop:6074 length:855 start_codon:yes stop_codon:yes gene_type:complete
MNQYNPKKLSLKDKHQLLLSSIAPRPIGFASSKNLKGQINLAPFSYHNAFSSNPPVIGISPAYSGRTGNPKNTLLNILETKEFALSVVTYNMVDQMNICSAEYSPEIDEFKKSGLTKYPAKMISVPGVAESPIIMECRYLDYIELSKEPAGGNLILAEIVYFHTKDNIYNELGEIDPILVDQVSRLGQNWYSRANQGLFNLSPPRFIPIGFDNLPKKIKNSNIFSNQQLARLAFVEKIPPIDKIKKIEKKYNKKNKNELLEDISNLIDDNKIYEAWQLIHLGDI